MSLSDRYDTFYRSSLEREIFTDGRASGWPRNRVEAIVAYAGEGGSVLDVGCGSGQLLFHLRNRFTKLIGLEYSALRLAQAQVNLAELPFVAIQGSMEAISDIKTGSVDCVVSADTIEHVPDVYLAANELYRVLRPGGRLVINTPNIAFVKKRALLLLGRFPSTSQSNEGFGSDVLFDGGHLHYFTFQSRSLPVQAGWTKNEK